MARPRRLVGFDYASPNRYFLTFCTLGRAKVFTDPSLLAYCVMPDHVHLLAESERPPSDLLRFMKMLKQRSGGAFSRRFRRPLWQPGYYEHVLRQDEDVLGIARYILDNPVRAGLVAEARSYPFSGSDRWTLAELVGSL